MDYATGCCKTGDLHSCARWVLVLALGPVLPVHEESEREGAEWCSDALQFNAAAPTR